MLEKGCAAARGVGYLAKECFGTIWAWSRPLCLSQRFPDRKSLEHGKRFGRSPFYTNPYEDFLIEDAINPDRIDVMFESIGGLENIKRELQDLVVLPLSGYNVISDYKPLDLEGVLLYGPPGTGKTMLAQAIAKESRAVIINVKVSNLMTNVLRDSQKLVSALFTLARKLQPSIIFIDEVDDFLRKRRSSDRDVMINIKSEFISMWSRFAADHQNAKVMILAVTNRPLFELDESILRNFFRSIEIGIPTHKERAEILMITLKGERVDKKMDYDYLAGLCEGCTGSDLVDLCNKAAYLSLTNQLEAKKQGNPNQARRRLAQADLEKAFLEYKKTTTAAYEYSKRALQ